MAEFYVGKCNCGGDISVTFGFSCTGKSQTTMWCEKCQKVVIKIGNLNKNLMEIWREAGNG